ncbi:MAG: hypothetical protein ROZ36_11450, partial [Thermincola sp.]|nr:hypothetical protein [Thermincola sp.]
KSISTTKLCIGNRYMRKPTTIFIARGIYALCLSVLNFKKAYINVQLNTTKKATFKMISRGNR